MAGAGQGRGRRGAIGEGRVQAQHQLARLGVGHERGRRDHRARAGREQHRGETEQLVAGRDARQARFARRQHEHERRLAQALQVVGRVAALKNFVEKAAQATLVGDVFDDAATGERERATAPAGNLIALAPRIRCPFCGGFRTRLDNVFGPTLCRSIAYCLDCREPFEQFKTV